MCWAICVFPFFDPAWLTAWRCGAGREHVVRVQFRYVQTEQATGAANGTGKDKSGKRIDFPQTGAP